MPGMPSEWIWRCCSGVISRLIQAKPASVDSLLAQRAGVEIGQHAGEQLGRLVGIEDVARLGIERRHVDVGRQDLAVAVDDVGPAGGDGRVGIVAGAGRSALSTPNTTSRPMSAR